ncbi:hypothetical protein ACTFIZ_009399 [Dictyostelium cf. discoideum]
MGGNKQHHQACIQCAGVTFSKDEFGFLECDNCHTRVEGYFTQEVEEFENGGGYKTGSYKRVWTQEVLDAMNQKKLRQKDNRYYILQNLLKIQVTSLIKDHGYNEQLYQVTGELWFKLLDKFSQDFEGGSSSSSSTSTSSSSSSNTSTFGIINYPPPFITLSICYLACVYLREPVIISDFISLAQSGKIASFTNETTWSFSWSNSNSTFINFARISDDICKYLNFLPSSNIPLLLLRFCTELKLPKSILNLSNQLYNLILIPFKLFRKKSPNSTLTKIYENIILPSNSDLLCVSIIMLILKSKFNLFDRQYNFNKSSGSNYNNNKNNNNYYNNNNDNNNNNNNLNDNNNNNNEYDINNIDKNYNKENSIERLEFLKKLINNCENSENGDIVEERIKEEIEKMELENWLYGVIYNLPKNEFLSKQDTWSLNIQDFKGIPKLKPSSIRRLITDQIHSKYDSLSDKYQNLNNSNNNIDNNIDNNININNIIKDDEGTLNEKVILKVKKSITKMTTPSKSKKSSTSSSSSSDATILLPKVRNIRNVKSINKSVNGLDYYFWLISILQKLIHRQHKEINLFLNRVEQIYFHQVKNLSPTNEQEKEFDNNNNNNNNNNGEQKFKLNERIPTNKIFR